jgi:hypothetical protein
MATASLSLRDLPGVSPQTRSRVRAVASDLGYRCDATGAMLRSGQHLVVGLLPGACGIVWDHQPALAALVMDLGRSGCLISVLVAGTATPPLDALIILDLWGTVPVPADLGFGTPVIVTDLAINDGSAGDAAVAEIRRVVSQALRAAEPQRPATVVA